jgi:hypothetical protein
MPATTSLLASVQGDPIFMRRVNGWLTIFWVTMIPISYLMNWLYSVVTIRRLVCLVVGNSHCVGATKPAFVTYVGNGAKRLKYFTR